MDSVALSFSTNALSRIEMQPNIIDDQSQSYQSGDSLEQLQTLFTAQISGIDIAKNRLGTELYMRVPLETLQGFVNGDDSLLQTMISLINLGNEIPYHMDMILNVDYDPAQARKAGAGFVDDDMQRISGFAYAIENMGMARKLMTAGMMQADTENKNMVDLVFRRYEPYSPLGTERVGDGA